MATPVYQPFVQILYSVAIGIGFTFFPRHPVENAAGTVMFFFTLLVAAQDWYEYHDKSSGDGDNSFIFEFTQILAILALSQMFRYATEESLQPWLFSAAAFALTCVVWNLEAQFGNNTLFAATSGVLMVGSFSMAIFYAKLTAWVPSSIDSRWLIFVVVVLLLAGVLCVEAKFDK